MSSFRTQNRVRAGGQLVLSSSPRTSRRVGPTFSTRTVAACRPGVAGFPDRYRGCVRFEEKSSPAQPGGLRGSGLRAGPPRTQALVGRGIASRASARYRSLRESRSARPLTRRRGLRMGPPIGGPSLSVAPPAVSRLSPPEGGAVPLDFLPSGEATLEEGGRWCIARTWRSWTP